MGTAPKTSWQELQIGIYFCDVTLACEEKQIDTHKLNISSCSPVLWSIIEYFAMIYLKRVKFKDLQTLKIESINYS